MDSVDLLLAILHHLLVFSLAGLLAAEWVLVRPGLAGTNLELLAGIDRAYGAVAMAVIAIGAGRVFFGLKGWEFYVFNHMFWGKMTAFVAVGAALHHSHDPHRGLAQGRRRRPVPDREILAVRSWLKAEVAVFALIPVFAAAMARGY